MPCLIVAKWGEYQLKKQLLKICKLKINYEYYYWIRRIHFVTSERFKFYVRPDNSNNVWGSCFHIWGFSYYIDKQNIEEKIYFRMKNLY